MVHLEMSLASVDITDELIPSQRTPGAVHGLEAWHRAVAEAEDPCLLLDAEGMIASVSMPCVQLLGAYAPEQLLGRGMLDDLDLVDFTATPQPLLPLQLARIPPLLALSSGTLARGLLRIRAGTDIRILDAVATPLRGQGEVVGSLTFFHPV